MRRPTALVLALGLWLAAGCSGRGSDGYRDTGPGTDGETPTSDGGGTTDGGGSGAASIFDITSGKIKEGESVVLDDVIVTAVDGYPEYTGDVFVQEPTGGPGSGLKLYRPERADGGTIFDLKQGDRVKVEGRVKYFTPSKPFDDKKHPDKVHIKQLEKPRISHLASGPDPEPAVVSVAELTTGPTAEGWESVLVRVEKVAVIELVNKYGEVKVTGNLAVDDDLYPPDDVLKEIGACYTITGISVYFYGYKLNARSEADFEATTGCPEPPKPTTVTIKDIQDETSPDHPAKGDQVTVSGVITAVDGAKGTAAGSKYNAFWIQDGSGPYSGLAVHYEWDDATALKPVLGDTVEVSGTYTEYYDESQLTKVTFVSKGPGTIPPPEVIADSADIATGGSLAEQYEGVLVEVRDVEVKAEVKTTGTNPRVVGIELTSGLYVESDLYTGFLEPAAPTPGTKYQAIRGPLRYSFGNFKILPRSAEDMLEAQ